jgi:hypothetical protein
MPRKTTTQPVTGPIRSANAQRAYAAGEVTWTIDLVTPQERVQQRVANTSSRSAITLTAVAATIWLFDIVVLAAR